MKVWNYRKKFVEKSEKNKKEKNVSKIFWLKIKIKVFFLFLIKKEILLKRWLKKSAILGKYQRFDYAA